MDTPRIITEQALIARIRRKLRKTGRSLHRCRDGSRWRTELGEYYVVGDNNFVEQMHVDLRELGLDLGVLRTDEEVSDR